ADLIKSATEHTAARRFDQAHSKINELAALVPNDPELKRLRDALDDARRQQDYDTGCAQAELLMNQGRYAEAFNQFEVMLAKFPGDRRLLQGRDAAMVADTKRLGPPSTQQLKAAKPPASRAWMYVVGVLVLAVVAVGLYFGLRPAPGLEHGSVSPDSLSFVT